MASGLESSFNQCIRAAAGFSSVVPAHVAASFCGFDKLKKYMEYWLASRSADSYLRENFDIFEIWSDESASSKATRPPGRQLRASTMAQTSSLHQKQASKFPATAKKWLNLIEKPRKLGIDNFLKSGCSFKLDMKKRMVAKIIDKRTVIEAAVKKLNDTWKEKILETTTF